MQSHRSPPNIVFDFDHCQSNALEIRTPRSGPTIKQRPLRQQTVLDDFEHTRPLAKKLQYLHEHHDSKKRKRTPLENINPPAKRQGHPGKESSPIVISSRHSSISSSLLSISAKIPPPQPHVDTSPDELSKPSIETKRRRLLQMHDWAGLERKRPQPVHMKFADPEDRDQIGRRRPVKVNYNHPSGYQQPLRRITKLDRHKLFPNTLGTQSGKDQISIRFGSAVDQSLKDCRGDGSMADQQVRSGGFVYPDEYFSRLDTGKSYRIGGPIRESHRSEEILDPADVEVAQANMSLSDYGYREILTPSAFMDDSSSSPRQIEDAPGVLDHTEARSASGGSEWNLPDFSNQTLAGPALRLLVRDTPQSHTRESKERSITRGLDLATPLTPATQQSMPSHSYGQYGIPAGGKHAESDPSLESLTITTPDWGMATSRLKTEFHKHVYIETKSHKERSGIINTFHPRQEETSEHHVLEKDMRLAKTDETSHVLSTPNYLHQEPRESQKDEANWKVFLASDIMREVHPLATPLTRIDDSRYELSKQSSTSADSQTISKNIEQPNPAEDEEKIWQNFIFSDEDENTEWIIEELQPQAATPYDPSRPQPSIIAEVDTSPIKQNPHLIETSSTTSVGSLYSPSKTMEPRRSTIDPSWPSRLGTSPSDILDQASFDSETPQNFPSVLAEASDSLTASNESLPQQSRYPGHKAPPSSLIGQASSASVPKSSIPQQISSDELGLDWSPARTQLDSIKSREPKVVFTPPRRYIGGDNNEPPKPLHIGGRILRNGKKIGETGQKESGKVKGGEKRGRPRRLVQNEVDWDEILDD